MTVLTSKLLLNAAAFPWLYEQAGRSVMQSQDLAPRMPGSFYGSRENQDMGVPQLIFCENALPIAKGIASCSVTSITAGPGGGLNIADQGIVLRNDKEARRLFVPAMGANYVYNAENNSWASKSPFAFAGGLVTRAYVNGRTFVCYEKTKIVEYDMTTDTLNTIALTFPAGTAITDVRGIGSAGNYLLLFTDIKVFWCSPLNVLEFSDLNAGAGNQIPAQIQGQIVAILPLSKGAIIYTTKLALSMQLTNNSLAPFVFDSINGAGGVPSWERVAADSSEGYQYAFTNAGLQRISLNGSETIFADVTDFLVGGRFEYWDAVNKVVVSQDSGGPFIVKLTYVVNRYVVVSFGMSRYEFTYALVYDTALQRWGKVKQTHSDVFEYPYPSNFGPVNYDQIYLPWSDYGDTTYDQFGVSTALSQPAKRGIAFMSRDGSISLLGTDFTQSGTGSVIVLGHLQNDRNNQLTILRVELEGIKDGPTPNVLVLTSDKGYARDTVTEMDLVDSSVRYRDYSARVTGENHDIAIIGSFVLTSALIQGVNSGYR